MNPYYEPYMQGQNPYPYYSPYPMYPFRPVLSWEDEKEEDERRLKELYPAMARQIQPLVEEECDRMEYDGSMMFDEYPDPLQIHQISRRIYDQLDKSEFEDELAMQQTSAQNWREDLIRVLLLNEMRNRRRRRRDWRRHRMYW